MESSENSQMKIVNGDYGYVLEDVPHLTDYIADLPVTHTYHALFCFVCFINKIIIIKNYDFVLPINA